MSTLSPAERRHTERRRIERCLQDLIDSPINNRCVVCGHVQHNDLGYCQVGECSCSTGTSVASCAAIIRRDLSALLRENL